MEGVGSCSEGEGLQKHVGVQVVVKLAIVYKENPPLKEDLQPNPLPKMTNLLPKVTHHPPL